jgi:hypothetical protein
MLKNKMTETPTLFKQNRNVTFECESIDKNELINTKNKVEISSKIIKKNQKIIGLEKERNDSILSKNNNNNYSKLAPTIKTNGNFSVNKALFRSSSETKQSKYQQKKNKTNEKIKTIFSFLFSIFDFNNKIINNFKLQNERAFPNN